jgi:hypothetical protein
MTKDYHLTQERALELARANGFALIAGDFESDKLLDHLIVFANAALDKVLGEPDIEIESAEERTGAYFTNCKLSVKTYNGYVPKEGNKLYAPKGLT